MRSGYLAFAYFWELLGPSRETISHQHTSIAFKKSVSVLSNLFSFFFSEKCCVSMRWINILLNSATKTRFVWLAAYMGHITHGWSLWMNHCGWIGGIRVDVIHMGYSMESCITVAFTPLVDKALCFSITRLQFCMNIGSDM